MVDSLRKSGDEQGELKIICYANLFVLNWGWDSYEEVGEPDGVEESEEEEDIVGEEELASLSLDGISDILHKTKTKKTKVEKQ